MDLENEKIDGSEQKNDKSSKHNRVTKSGRATKTPKKLITSSDEAPPRRRPSKTSVSVKTELERLQRIAMAIKGKQETKKSTSKKVAQAKLKVASNNLVQTPVDNSTSLPTTRFGNASTSRNEDFDSQDWSDYNTSITPEGTTGDVEQVLNSSQRTLPPGNLVVSPVDNSTFLPIIPASEMAGQTEMRIMILPVHNTDSNADANALSNESRTERTIRKESPVLNISQRTLEPGNVVSLVDNLASLPTTSASEMSGQTEMAIVVNSRNTGNTIGNKAPAGHVTAASVIHVSNKSNSTSRFENAASTSKNGDSEFQEQTDHSRIPEHTSGDLQKIFETLQSIKEQNKEILEKQTEIKLQIDHIWEHLAEKNEAQVTETLYEPLKGFPLSTIQQFREMENVEQKITRQKLYEHVLKLGGTKPRDFLHCALKEIMTDKLVCEFSWRGDRTSEKFGNTKISNMLFRAAKSCPLFKGPETKSEFKNEIQEILRCTKQRYRNQIKKLKVPENEVQDIDGEFNNVMKEIERLQQQLHGGENSSDADSEEEDEEEGSWDET